MTITSSKLSYLLLNRADARDARRLEMLADVMTKVLAVSAFFAILLSRSVWLLTPTSRRPTALLYPHMALGCD